MPGRAANVTYVSRLQSVQGAIVQQIEQMMRLYPKRKVALVTFNSAVTIVGDGKQMPISIEGDRLCDLDAIRTVASRYS